MKLYSGAKTIKAKPMTLHKFYGRDNQVCVRLDEPGFMVGYPNEYGEFIGNEEGGCEYIGWSPATKFIAAYHEGGMEKASDGYHTFEELYEFRKLYNAAAFNMWAATGISTAKSRRHFDGKRPFTVEKISEDEGWFIVMANLSTGQISNHYEMKDWDLFQIPEYDTAPEEWDGHTSYDVVERLTRWLKGE